MDDMITALVRYHHERQIAGGGTWPGKPLGASAATRYPNLLAELGWSAPWLDTLADFADVSKEVMVAVLEDNEPLTSKELFQLSRHLGVSVGYLTAPKLAIIDPAANKGKVRRAALADLVVPAARLMGDFERQRAKYVLTALDSGEAIMYGPYRWAVNAAQNAIDSNCHKPRDFRMPNVRQVEVSE